MSFTTAGWTLSDIIADVRQVTGRPDTSMMSDQTIVDYIQRYYQYVLPKELKIFWGYTYYTFFTQANVDQYVGPTTTFQTLNPIVWCDGFQIDWYLAPDLFYEDFPAQANKQVVAQGDGITTTFAFNISAFPVLEGSVYVTDGTQVAQDNGSGGFTGDGTGTINYVTGAVNLTFTSAPAANVNIECTSQTFIAARPQAILYFKSAPLTNSTSTVRDNQNYFVLRPVPDDVYQIKMQGIQLPKPLINTTDVPFRADLGPLISYGASLKIFTNFNQMDQYDQTLVEYNRYKDICMQDTYEEYIYQRSVPAF